MQEDKSGLGEILRHSLRACCALVLLLISCAQLTGQAPETTTVDPMFGQIPHRHGGFSFTSGVLNLDGGPGGAYLSAGIPALFQLSIDLDTLGEGAGLHLALTTLPAAVYLDFDKNGIGIQLDTILATGLHFRTGLPGLSHLALDLWLFGSGLHLGTDSIYAWTYWGGGGIDFVNRRGFTLSPSPVHKARFFGAYGGPGFQGFGIIGAPTLGGGKNASELALGQPGFDERPRDAVDAAFRLHDIQFNGAGGPHSWAWGAANDQALVREIRRTSLLWWHDPFALSKALLTLAVWGGPAASESP